MAYNFNKTQFKENLESKGATVLFKTIATDMITPILASLKLFSVFKDYHFLFESAQIDKKGQNNKARFSVIGIDPDQAWKCVDGESFINENFSQNRDDFLPQNGDALQNFRQFFNDAKIDFSNLTYQGKPLPAVCSGVFGYFGYDMVNLMEKLPFIEKKDDINIPDSIFIRPQILVIFDNFYDTALICAPVFQNSSTAYESAVEKIENIENILHQDYIEPKIQNRGEFNFTSNYTEQEYCNTVEQCKKYIVDGDIFQILPSQRFVGNFDKSIPEFAFYRALRSLNPSPFLFFLKMDDFVLTGSSPEIMVSLKDKKVTIRPLAGTRKRGKTFEEDQEIAAELLADEKETAEHLMLIDLGRHDVGRVSKAGTVKTTEKMTIEYYSHVMHISSNVQGEIREGLDALDALISGFPAGTVSGAPKIRAMEILNEIETTKRSFYAGCVGYFASNGDMETCITLRSALIKDGKINLQAGAGVVFDSDPKSEYQECINKAAALVRACENIS